METNITIHVTVMGLPPTVSHNFSGPMEFIHGGSVKDLLSKLGLEIGHLLVVVNQRVGGPDDLLRDGDVVEILPIIHGG